MNGLQWFSLQCVMCGLAVLAARAESLTIDDAIRLARENNPEFRAAREQIMAAGGRAQQAALWPNPEIELSAEDVPTDDIGLSRSKNLIGVAQTVPFPGKKSLDGRIGRQEVIATEWTYRAKERELIRDVTLAFYGVQAGEKKAAVSAELVSLARSLADTTRKRVAAGDAADQEQLRAEIELERASIEAAAAQRELVAARRTLARWLGREEIGPITGELPATVATRPRPTGHPQLAAATAQRERAELELRRAKLEPLPDVTLGVAGGRDRAAHETLMELRVSLPLPLFDRAQGRKREAHALAEIARHDLTATEQRLAQEWDVAVARLQTAQSQADAYRARILPKAEEALRLVRGGFEAGKFGFLDLLDTQRTAVEVRLAYYDILLELNTAAADLDALAGPKENQ
jgi:outer membrane protein, heavy metal efflux system